MKPQPLPKIFPHKPRIVFTDVDDTLTWKGRLPLETFTALVKLQQSGIKVIPVTGASAGWCDCMIRTWPIESIIGENGAYFVDCNSEDRFTYHYAVEESERRASWQRLLQLKEEVVNKFANAHSTADQPFRLTNIAFDINQDRKVERSDAFEIAKYCEASGMNVKVSSTHINVWCGEYNKASMANEWLAQHAIESSEAMFIGDSPNDDSMFSNFAHTVGVANIQPFIAELDSPPDYMTHHPGGYGFVEMAASLIEGRHTDRSS
ncbi:MAG: HAD family phosphatase [Gammaproteobacteria bacterium]|nr:HAD family phosphatase [Gammaproteobacteria bacterium]